MNSSSMVYIRTNYLTLKHLLRFHQVFYYDSNPIYMGVKGVLKHEKRQYSSKITRNTYHLQKIKYSIHEYQEKICWFQK